MICAKKGHFHGSILMSMWSLEQVTRIFVEIKDLVTFLLPDNVLIYFKQL